MANISTTVDLVINRLSQAKYEQLCAAGQLDENQLYMTTGEADITAQISDYYYMKSETSSATQLADALNVKLEATDVNISYNSNERKILLSSKQHVTSVDCNDFIKDGMLSTAELCGTTLVLTFNTDAGSSPISVEMSSFVDNYDGKIQQLSTAIDEKTYIDGQQVDSLSIAHISQEEFYQKAIASAFLSNELYVVSGTYINAYGRQLKNLSGPTDLSDAATKEYVDAAISDVQIPSDLSSFTNSPGYLVSNDISDYYKKSETSSASEISNAFRLSSGNKVFIDDRISGIYEQSDLSIVHLSSTEYEQLCANNQLLSNALYIVEDSYTNNYGKQIKNLAPGTDLQDAVNLEQLSNAISSIQIPSDLSSFTNSPGYLVSNDISDYYKKSETSSAAEISNALSVKAETSSLVQYLALSGGTMSSDAVIRFGDDWLLSTRINPIYTNCKELKISASNGQTWTFNDSGDPDAYSDGSFVIRDGDLWNLIGYYVNRKADLLPFAQTFEDYVDREPERHIWNDSDEYSLNDTVAYEGKFYRCSQAADSAHPPTDTDYWEEIPYLLYAQYNGFSMLYVTWETLVDMRTAGLLFPGMKYRITDYVTTVDQTDCSSAMHPFDLIVTAIDHHTLDEHATATLPSNGDDYFDARQFHVPAYQQYLEYARVPLESWEIKYCLDNDKMRFKFADTENGKGVIYYMKDEFGNEAPYDFKNVLFKRYLITSSPGATSLEGMYGLAVNNIEVDTSDEMWCYTFNGIDYQDFGFSEPYDFSGWHVRPTQAVIQQFGASVERLQECTGNVIQAKQQDENDFSLMSFKLPNNVFHCALTYTPVDELPFLKVGYCIENKLGSVCYDNTFGHSQLFNILGNDCDSNTFGNNCDSNTFGNNCGNNTFGNDCDSNTFGNNCDSNTFGNNCGNNTFGNNCNSNTFGNNCDSNTFGNSCVLIYFAFRNAIGQISTCSYYKYITVDSGNQYIILYCSQATYIGNEYKNIRILLGVNNTTTYKMITDNNVNQSFCTTYQPANSQVIAV